MFYVARKGTPTFDRLTNMDRRATDAIQAALDFVKAEFGETKHYGLHWHWGGISGVVFENGPVPEGWIKCHAYNAYHPHRSRKSLADIRVRSAALPAVSHDELGKAVEFGDVRIIDGRMYTGPNDFLCGSDMCLFAVSDKLAGKYKAPADAEEVTSTVYYDHKTRIQAEKSEGQK